MCAGTKFKECSFIPFKGMKGKVIQNLQVQLDFKWLGSLNVIHSVTI